MKFERYDQARFLHEISTMLDLFDAFNIMAYRKGISTQKTLVISQTIIQ